MDKGYTLLELLTVLAIVSILLAIGVPALNQLHQDNRQTAIINEFAGHLRMAREHAVRQHARVMLCTQKGGSSHCSTTTHWENGWLLFEDQNTNGTCADNNGDGRCDDDGGRILASHSGLPKGLTLRTSRQSASHAFRISASGTTGDNTFFSLCDRRGSAAAKGLAIIYTGRVRLAPASDLPPCPVTIT